MVYVISDHAGHELKQAILNKISTLKTLKNEQIQKLTTTDFWLNENFLDLNPEKKPGDNYPEIAQQMAFKMKEDQDNNIGLAICGSGQGICMALNRFSWIRAGLVNKAKEARLLKNHNHGNVICFGQNFINSDEAVEILKIFLETKHSQETRHINRVHMLSSLNNSL